MFWGNLLGISGGIRERGDETFEKKEFQATSEKAPFLGMQETGLDGMYFSQLKVSKRAWM